MPKPVGSLGKYPARFSVLSYAAVIVVGTVLLVLPVSVRSGRASLSLVDALFTATSALCVTGLTVRSTAHDLSGFGQAVVLALIQLGGIGIVTITTFLTFQLGHGRGLRDRTLASEAVGSAEPMDLRSTLTKVVLFTLLVEFAGFVILAVRNAFDMGRAEAIWHALFHSVSAYCNAGFALHDDSLTSYQGDVLVNLVIASLIVVGGIGFPVILDLWHHREFRPREIWTRLRLHSKMMLIGTVLLIGVGMAVFLVFEAGGVLREMSWPRRVLVSFFSSVTARTAGFNVVDYDKLTNATLFITVLLMIIGAGPCSTGGGMKVTTFFVVVLHAWSTWRGRVKINLMRRTIAPTVVDRATTAVLLFGAVAIAGITILLIMEQSSYPHSEAKGLFMETVFEVTSALGTVGLSTGLTTQLCAASRIVLIALMFVGRLGPISIAIAISQRERRMPFEYPEAEPLIG